MITKFFMCFLVNSTVLKLINSLCTKFVIKLFPNVKINIRVANFCFYEQNGGLNIIGICLSDIFLKLQ